MSKAHSISDTDSEPDAAENTKMGNSAGKKTANGRDTDSCHSGTDGEVNGEIRKIKRRKKNKMVRSWSEKDTKEYREGYPGKKDIPFYHDNKKFYFNELESSPSGDLIDNIHKDWYGNYTLLEQHHGYIQWLFPIREKGMNWQAKELQLHEAKAIKENKDAHRRVIKSYEIMLDFYGMKLHDETTGEITRSDNWRDRFSNLNRSCHNYLRITRILKSLGELGFEHYKKPFVYFCLLEALEHRTLKGVLDSCLDYWLGTLRTDDERKGLQEFAKKYVE